MKVKAIATGYYNNQLKPEGSVFELVAYKADKLVFDDAGKPVFEKGTKVQKVEKDHEFTAEEQFSEKWMEEVEGKEAVGVMKHKEPQAGKPLPAQHGEIKTKADKDVI